VVVLTCSGRGFHKSFVEVLRALSRYLLLGIVWLYIDINYRVIAQVGRLNHSLLDSEDVAGVLHYHLGLVRNEPWVSAEELSLIEVIDRAMVTYAFSV